MTAKFDAKEVRHLMETFSKVFYKWTVGNPELRADLVQDAMEKVLIEADKAPENADERMRWANTVGTRHGINRIKHSARRDADTSIYSTEGDDFTESVWASAVPGWRPVDPETAVLNKERKEVLALAKRRLSDDQRDALTLVYGQGLTHDEAAIACNVPLGTMLTRVRRARQVLARNPRIAEYTC